ncbi:hypothetical protein HDU87_007354 [Geranomyces variabilis]|uniref:Uncharacterized protein n=1 Tax=Geranomyces variabilis TaxID=109894 RepID=A0AAD5XPV6_9FUNG|nr:hypothetical protein HDU87_007354 [Geranomyces variabilis]
MSQSLSKTTGFRMWPTYAATVSSRGFLTHFPSTKVLSSLRYLRNLATFLPALFARSSMMTQPNEKTSLFRFEITAALLDERDKELIPTAAA